MVICGISDSLDMTDSLWFIKLRPHEPYLSDNLKQLAEISWHHLKTSAQQLTAHAQDILNSAITQTPEANVIVSFGTLHPASLPVIHKTHLAIRLYAGASLHKQAMQGGWCYHINPQAALSEISNLFADKSNHKQNIKPPLSGLSEAANPSQGAV